ncbi:class A sortase [Vagococcus lutrae]|uniref:class A sortase n=1 Tax=Vagococcus lutrae TaxID=81947 RepID=UPI00288CA416|nr:class A sortase [Vagococcus lutrae]MDT2826218.1 class A sortase [Vagococcus lutrae]
MRKKQSDYIVLILMLIGISVLFYPFFKMSLLVEKTNQVEFVFDSGSDDLDRSEKLSKIQPPTLKQIMKMDTTVTYESILKIPSLKKNLIISNDTTDSSFFTGVVNMYPKRNPLKDNIVILGHHLSDSGLLLGDVGKLKIGDKLILEKAEGEYQYSVIDVYITDETKVSVLETSESPKLTMITCDKPTYTDKRMIVEANLIDVKKNKKIARDVNDKKLFLETVPIKYANLNTVNNKNNMIWLLFLYSIIIILVVKVFL